MNSVFRAFLCCGISIACAVNADLPSAGVPSETPSPKPSPNAVAIPDLNQARLGSVQQMDRKVALEKLVRALGETDSPLIRKSILQGILKGLEGERLVTPPSEWKWLGKALRASDDAAIKRLSMQLAQVFGDESATEEALALLQNEAASIEDRRVAFRSLLAQKNARLPSVLEMLVGDEEFRVEAIRAYAAYSAPEGTAVLVNQYSELPGDAQLALIETLATRKEYAVQLFDALESGQLPPDAVPAYVARGVGKLLGGKFNAKYGVQKMDEDKSDLIALYRKIASPTQLASANPSKGRVVYHRVCMACHVMYGEGGVIGPELTGSNRADLEYLLLNILDPSGDIADAYKLVTITTKDGQILAGSVVEEDDNKIVLNMVGQKSTVLKADVLSKDVSPVSMMPEGLFQNLTQPEVLDLIKYMQTKEQVSLPR